LNIFYFNSYNPIAKDFQGQLHIYVGLFRYKKEITYVDNGKEVHTNLVIGRV
jgi:hypothetical protein